MAGWNSRRSFGRLRNIDPTRLQRLRASGRLGFRSFPIPIMALESELRLAFPRTALSSILSHRLICRAPRERHPQVLVVGHFDTPELALSDAGIAVRTYKAGTRWLQTVKCAPRSARSVASHREWEQPFAGYFDFSAIDVPDVREILEAQAALLVPLFVTRFRRETRIAQPRSGVRLLVMIDTGKILAGEREIPIHEAKLKLAQGSEIDLLNFAIELAENLPLCPFDQTKAQRGFRLLCREANRPATAGKSPVIPTWTALQAFRALATQEMRCWQANVYGAMASPAPEFVHQFRVSLRRLHTLLKVYKSILPREFVATWSDILGKLAAGTDEARDLDVLRESILQPVLESENCSALEALMRRSMDACRTAHQAERGSLSAIENGVSLLMFAKALTTLPDDGAAEDLPLFARAQLKRMRSRARKRLGSASQTCTPKAAHQLRIALKHLRYSCEFFAPLFDQLSMARLAKDAATVQDELGFLNDLNIAWNRLGDWAQDDPGLLAARARVASWHAGRAAKSLATVFDEAKALLGQHRRWRHVI